jgi:hypothetical protein
VSRTSGWVSRGYDFGKGFRASAVRAPRARRAAFVAGHLDGSRSVPPRVQFPRPLRSRPPRGRSDRGPRAVAPTAAPARPLRPRPPRGRSDRGPPRGRAMDW